MDNVPTCRGRGCGQPLRRAGPHPLPCSSVRPEMATEEAGGAPRLQGQARERRPATGNPTSKSNNVLERRGFTATPQGRTLLSGARRRTDLGQKVQQLSLSAPTAPMTLLSVPRHGPRRKRPADSQVSLSALRFCKPLAVPRPARTARKSPLAVRRAPLTAGVVTY